MTYINQIKAFQEVAQDKQLSTGQIALYHILLYINNRCAWIEWFTVANLSLELNSGLSRSGIAKNRNILKQLGLIDFKSNGTKATQYSITDLEKTVFNSNQVSTQVGTQVGTQVSTQVSTQVGGTLKDKTRLDNIKDISKDISKKQDAFLLFSNENTCLLLALRDFEKMRKSIKKPLTDRAKQMLITELCKLSQNSSEQIAILEQSILNNWQTVYALKTQKTGGKYNELK